jgi:hypothetical protein
MNVHVPLSSHSDVDYHTLTKHRSSVLLVGAVSSTEATLRILAPSWTNLVTFWQPGRYLALPSGGGTLVLERLGFAAVRSVSAL